MLDAHKSVYLAEFVVHDIILRWWVWDFLQSINKFNATFQRVTEQWLSLVSPYGLPRVTEFYLRLTGYLSLTVLFRRRGDNIDAKIPSNTNSIFTNSVFWRRVHLLQFKREIKKKIFLFLTHYENTLWKAQGFLNKRFTLSELSAIPLVSINAWSLRICG